MATIIQHLLNLMDERCDPRTKHLPLMDSPFPVIGILIFYIYFVNKLGPRLMSSRKPFNLKYFMIFYNIIQIISNTYVCCKIIDLAYVKFRYSLICAEVDYSDNPVAVSMYLTSWILLLIKILDLLDTVIMVLRKKERQISFLHVFHHTGMVIALWYAVKFMPGGHTVLVPVINCAVHAIMYFYYLLTVLDPELKRSIWWKKHLTELQMVQFVILSIHGLVAVLNPYCNFRKIPLAIFSVHNILMLLMFWDFYKKSYINNKINKLNNNNIDYNKKNVKIG